MPKVPLYQGNQIKEADIPNVAINANTSVSNYKSGLDGALSQAPAVYDAYQEQKKKADQIAIYEADAKLSKLETSLLYDKDHGATNLKGKSSFSAPEIVSDGYNKGAKEIEDGLTNDDQKQSFAKLQLERGVSIDRTVQRHVGNEIVKYDNDTTSNFVKNEQDAAIAAYQDPARIALSIVRQKEAVQNYAERNGMPPEEATQKIADVESKTHAQVINRMLTNDQDVTADNYYKSNKDFIKGDDLAHVEKMIEAGSLRGKSQRFVDEAVKGGLSETAAIDKARSEFKDDPKLRDAAAERVRMEYNMRDSAKKKQLEDYHVAALNYIDQGNAKDYSKVAGWDQMSVNQRESLRNYAKSKAEGKDILTNYNVYYDLKTMSSTPELQDKFIKSNLMDYRNDLNNGDFEKMVDLQAQLRKGTVKGKSTADGFRSDNQVVKQTYEQAGLPNNKEQLALFNSMVEKEQMVQQERNGGKKLNNSELEKIAKEQAFSIVTKEGFLWDSTKPLYKVKDEELQSIPYKAVPSTDKIKIEAALKKSNIPSNPETVRQFYIKKIMKDRQIGK